MPGIGGLRSLMGQWAAARFRRFRRLGCLRSLRARSALDGVSWAQGGSVQSRLLPLGMVHGAPYPPSEWKMTTACRWAAKARLSRLTKLSSVTPAIRAGSSSRRRLGDDATE